MASHHSQEELAIRLVLAVKRLARAASGDVALPRPVAADLAARHPQTAARRRRRRPPRRWPSPSTSASRRSRNRWRRCAHAGLVKTARDPNDGRKTLISITKSGPQAVRRGGRISQCLADARDRLAGAREGAARRSPRPSNCSSGSRRRTSGARLMPESAQAEHRRPHVLVASPPQLSAVLHRPDGVEHRQLADERRDHAARAEDHRQRPSRRRARRVSVRPADRSVALRGRARRSLQQATLVDRHADARDGAVDRSRDPRVSAASAACRVVRDRAGRRHLPRVRQSAASIVRDRDGRAARTFRTRSSSTARSSTARASSDRRSRAC